LLAAAQRVLLGVFSEKRDKPAVKIEKNVTNGTKK
jgi:hypothetical protein